jgi:Ala-tRNA(Pro) deacylase
MVCKDRLEQCLEQAEVPYSFQEHRTVFTAQEVAQTEHIPGHMMAKPVIVNADGNLAMLVLPATEKLDMRKASDVLHAKALRLASETEFQERFTDCELGAIPAFGNLYGVPVVVDQKLAENESIVTQAGTHSETVRVRFHDFERVVQPTIADVHH